MASPKVSPIQPLLYLAIVHSRDTNRSAAASPAFYQRTIIMLWIGPFIWALPTIIIPIPTIIRDRSLLHPEFYQAACTISDTAYQSASLSLMVTPLLFATGVSIAFAYKLWRSVKLPITSHSLGILDVARIIRFGALLAIIALSAILYTTVMANWAMHRINPAKAVPMNIQFEISVVWEAVTPILMFFIFGAQEEIFDAWASCFVGVGERLKHTLSPTSSREKGDTESDLLYSDNNSQDHVRWTSLPQIPVSAKMKTQRRRRDSGISGIFDSSHNEPNGQDTSSMGGSHSPTTPISPIHMNLPNVGGPIRNLTDWNEQASLRPGLLPPPRPARGSRGESTAEYDLPPPDFSRTIGSMPSLSSLGSAGVSNTISDSRSHGHRAADSSFSGLPRRLNPMPDSRPNTGESARSDRTFG